MGILHNPFVNIKTSELKSMRSAKHVVNIISVTLGCTKLPYDSILMYKYIQNNDFGKIKENYKIKHMYMLESNVMASSESRLIREKGTEISQC